MSADAETALVARLKSWAELLPLVAGRVHSDAAEGSEGFPRIIVSRTSTRRSHALDADSGLPGARVQVDCQGTTRKQARTVARQVRLALNGKRGTWGEVFVQACLIDDDFDDYLPPEHAGERGLYVSSFDVSVFFEEL